MKNNFENFDISDLIYYLDQKQSFSKYRNSDAEYDDLFYSNIPLNKLIEIGIDQGILDKIRNNTDSYDGYIILQRGFVSLGGGA